MAPGQGTTVVYWSSEEAPLRGAHGKPRQALLHPLCVRMSRERFSTKKMAQHRKKRTPDLPEQVRRDGALCAVFVNTASAKRASLATFDELLAWGRHHGALGDSDFERLAHAAAERPAAAAEVLRRALELRDRLARILDALVAHTAPAAEDLAALESDYARALAVRRLVPATGGGYRFSWGDHGGDDRVLWPILESAIDVLTSRYHRKVHRCAAEGCDLLFVDRTPGSPRKWCDMKTCGTRSGSVKYYRRTLKPRRDRRRRETRLQRARIARADEPST